MSPECRNGIEKGKNEQNIESKSIKSSKQTGLTSQAKLKKASAEKMGTPFSCFSKV